MSNIPWTDKTWNPVTGCTKVSSGCINCYAERMAFRLKKMGNARYKDGFKVTMQKGVLEKPLLWDKPRKIFVCSMSDFFHPRITRNFRRAMFRVMKATPHHTYQVLSKRPEQSVGMNEPNEIPNLWLGVTVEDHRYLKRIDYITAFSNPLKFISFEPLLGPIPEFDMTDIGWVIVGGENGPGARPMNPDWVRSIRDRVIENNIPFFFKGWGKNNKDMTIDGKLYQEFPQIPTKGNVG